MGIGVGAFHVLRNGRRLRVPEDGNADRLDVTGPTADAVEGIGLRSAPARKEESARHGLVVAVKVPQERNQFIALDQQPAWIADDQLSKGFVACIVGAVSDRGGRLRLLPQLQIDSPGMVVPFLLSSSFARAVVTCLRKRNASSPAA